MVLGYFIMVLGFNVVLMGENTYAPAMDAVAIGRFNVGAGSDTWTATEPIFEIGIGTSNGARANAMTVLKSGNVGIGTTTPSEILHVVGNVKIQGQAYSPSQSSSAATPLTFDADGGNVMSWSTGAQTNLVVNLNNMKDGASYTLALRGSGVGSTTLNCFSGNGTGGLTSSFMPANADRVATASIYTILRVGAYCYISWSTGWP